MRKEGVVSLWMGWIDSKALLDQYVATKYTDDGDSIPSDFVRDWGIGPYDHDFQEIAFLEPFEQKLEKILSGISYEEKIVPQVLKLLTVENATNVNAIILLYNYSYEGSQKQREGLKLHFIGTVAYE
jgi:hypothetical protein